MFFIFIYSNDLLHHYYFIIHTVSNESLVNKAKDFISFVESSTSSSPVLVNQLQPKEISYLFETLKDLYNLFISACKINIMFLYVITFLW